MTNYLKLLLRREGYRFNTTAELETVRTIKERACFITSDLQTSVNAAIQAKMNKPALAPVLDKKKNEKQIAKHRFYDILKVFFRDFSI